jgi:DNA-binding MarR family transcriptional regulator
MPDKLVAQMLQFAEVARRLRARLVATKKERSLVSLSDRDLLILQHLARQEAGESGFSHIQERLQGRVSGGVSASALSQAIKALTRQGFLDKRTDPRDERSKIISLTPRGRHVQEAFDSLEQELMNEIRAAMDPNESEEQTLSEVFARGILRLTQRADEV